MASGFDLPRLILGSASPRRAALMRQVGLSFEQIVSPEEELVPDGRPPAEFALVSARAKARAVHRLVSGRRMVPSPFIVIGADTIVCLGDLVLGKPSGPEEAAAMLRALSGREHQVYTGLSVVTSAGDEISDRVATRVRMRRLSPDEIEAYIATGEPLDKAGSYGIQGIGACFIEQIEGCYYNVVGLPLSRLVLLLERAGHPFILRKRSAADE